MSSRSDPDIDDDFSEIYKAYTGPLGTNSNNAQEKATADKKRPNSGSDEEEEVRDPNAVPNDFTSREAKVWEAKSKATERNWKKRKEEEMICKICGESGHFTQGCPSTLGANRKSQDFFERVPARDKHVRSLFTERVVQKIEKDIGCKFKMDEKFIIVGGKDRLVLAKGVEAVRKIIEEGGDPRDSSSSSHVSRSRSPERSPVGSRFQRSDPQRPHSGPRVASHVQQRFHRQEKPVNDRGHDIMPKFSRDSSQAYGNDGARGLPSHSKSPSRPSYTSNAYGPYDGRNQTAGGACRTDGWDSERLGPDVQSGGQFVPKTLDDLEMVFEREIIELGRIRDKEEDEENYRHREAVTGIRENYSKKLAMLRDMHSKRWEDFLQLDAQRRKQQHYQQQQQQQQQQARQQMPSSGYSAYKEQGFPNYDGSSTNPSYAGSNNAMDSMNRFPNPMENNYPSRPLENFGEFQHQRREDYGKAYNRY